MPPRRQVRRDAEFARRLRIAMEEVRVKPGQLAEAMDVAPETVSRWRSGELPDDLRLPDLASHLQVRLNWLKSGAGAMKDPIAGVRETVLPYGEPVEGIGWLWQDEMAARERVLGLLGDWEHTVRTSNSGFDPSGFKADLLDGIVAQAEATGKKAPGWLIEMAYEAGKRARR